MTPQTTGAAPVSDLVAEIKAITERHYTESDMPPSFYDRILAWLDGIGCARCGHDHHTPRDCDTWQKNDGSVDNLLCHCDVTDVRR